MGALTIWSAVNNVTSSISAIVSTYRTAHIIKKEDAVRLKMRLQELERVARARGLGELARTNIEEIRKTQNYIDQCSLYGESLDFAMDTLRALSDSLRKNLEEYSNGY